MKDRQMFGRRQMMSERGKQHTYAVTVQEYESHLKTCIEIGRVAGRTLVFRSGKDASAVAELLIDALDNVEEVKGIVFLKEGEI